MAFICEQNKLILLQFRKLGPDCVLGRLKSIADRLRRTKDCVVEDPTEDQSHIIQHGFSLIDADHMLNSCVQEYLACVLRVAGGDHRKVQPTGVCLLEGLLEVIFKKESTGSVLLLKNKGISLAFGSSFGFGISMKEVIVVFEAMT
jgi:hypothetical protein